MNSITVKGECKKCNTRQHFPHDTLKQIHQGNVGTITRTKFERVEWGNKTINVLLQKLLDNDPILCCDVNIMHLKSV